VNSFYSPLFFYLSNSEVEVNYKYEEIKNGHLMATNNEKVMERKGDEVNMLKTDVLS